MLSLPKILLTVAVIAAVVFVVRLMNRRGTSQQPAAKKAPADEAVNLVECTVCSTYVAADKAGCARADCPYKAR